jgi:dephospho-CoA kinase
MRIIGILGGIASGKSLVTRQFAQLGAGVLDADQMGHEVLQLPHIEAAARRRWGDGIFGPEGRIDRTGLARIVFGPGPNAQKERKYLEQLTHPEIAHRLWRQIGTISATATTLVVLDAALLLETGWDKWCEKIVFVDAPREMRMARAVSRGWSEADFAAREAAQDSLEGKRARADVIVDNSGSPERTQAQVEQFWASLIH